MRSPRLPLAALVAALAVAAAPAPALAKHKPKVRSSATYAMTFHAVMKESWKYDESYADDCELTGDMCTREAHGDGAATTWVDTRGQQTCLNQRGFGGRPPSLCLGSDQPAVKVAFQRAGGFKTTYGGPWKGGNPDVVAPTSGCGRHTVNEQVGLFFEHRRELRPSIVVSEPTGDCPDGPPESIDWKGGDGPSLMDVAADADPHKFLGTKQFSVSGSRTWTGTWGPFSRADGLYRYSGTKTVTWQWTATFRLKKR
jgi:hypothetical protein